MTLCVKLCREGKGGAGGCGRASGRAARPLNLMKETLTVRPSVLAALARGDARVRAHVELMERGTAEDIWMDEVRRGALIRWDILKRRALYPVREPSRASLVMLGEKFKKTLSPTSGGTPSPFPARGGC